MNGSVAAGQGLTRSFLIMPESAAYLLFAFGVVLLIGSIIRPRRLNNAEETVGPRLQDKVRLGLRKYRRTGLVIKLVVIGLTWYPFINTRPDSKRIITKRGGGRWACIEYFRGTMVKAISRS